MDAGNDAMVSILGTLPDTVCRDENTCDELYDDDTVGCSSHLDACLAKLTPDQQRQWANAISSCLASTTTCADRFTCYAAVPWC